MNDDYVGDDKVLTKEVFSPLTQLISNGGIQYLKKQYMLILIPTSTASTAASASAAATAATATKKIQVPQEKKNIDKVWLDNDDVNIGRNL